VVRAGAAMDDEPRRAVTERQVLDERRARRRSLPAEGRRWVGLAKPGNAKESASTAAEAKSVHAVHPTIEGAVGGTRRTRGSCCS